MQTNKMGKPKLPVNAYILTGGQSRRLKTDKSLVKLGDNTITELLYDRLAVVFKNVYVVGKNTPPGNLPFIPDLNHIQCPLNGIVTALDHSSSEWIFIIACDQPFVQNETIIYLYGHISQATQIIIPKTDNKLHMTSAFYHQSTRSIYKKAIAQGKYAIYEQFGILNVKKITITIQESEQFLNINTHADIERAKKFFLKWKRNNFIK